MKEITVDAVIENVAVVTEFVEACLDSARYAAKTKMQINIAIDEIFSNIARYAYQNEVGQATVNVEMLEEPKAVCITFIDSGAPYNPLTQEEPDITLSAEKRNVGGLGIYMVRKTMDELEYRYSEEKNIFSMKKYETV